MVDFFKELLANWRVDRGNILTLAFSVAVIPGGKAPDRIYDAGEEEDNPQAIILCELF